MNFIKKAVNKGCDCYISGKINNSEASFARDIGVNLIEISPYKTEIIALKKLCNILSLEFPHVGFLLFESKDPIKTYF
jgi:putative NIF3 family GTP cyclohydrolase 1 type 2